MRHHYFRPGRATPIARQMRLPLLWIAPAVAALAAPAGAGGSVTIGSPLTSAAQVASCGPSTFTNTAVGAGTLQAPYDGVIVRWRMKLQTGGGSFTYKLRVIRPAGGSNYTGAGTGPAQTVPAAGVNVIALPTPLPVKAGDLIAVDCPNGAPAASAVNPPAASRLAFFNPFLVDATTRSPNNQLGGEEELVNADVVGVPAIASVGPASGSTAGGTSVIISGSRLADVTGVTFGGVAATAVTVVGDNQVTVSAPAHAAGAVDVQASSAAGTSPVVTGDAFTYVAPPPAISGLSQAHGRWRARKGTSFAFTLNEQAGVSLAFTQKLAGRRVHGRCVPQSRRNRTKPACKRTVRRGTLTVSGAAGANKLSFKGLISRSKRLGAGRYTVTIVATSPAGLKSAPQ